MPDPHRPIIRTCNEDGTVNIVPEWITTNTVNRAHVTIVVGLIALSKLSRALVNRAVLSGHKVVIAWIIRREVK